MASLLAKSWGPSQGVAQLGERDVRDVEAGGSIPLTLTKFMPGETRVHPRAGSNICPLSTIGSATDL